MTLLALIVACGTLLLAGAGITLSLPGGRARLNVIECFCLSWLFGVGAISLLLWIGGSFLSGIALQLLIAVTSVAFAFGGWKLFGGRGARFYFPRPATRWEWILTTVLVAQIAAVFYASCKHTLGWDGLLVWEIKARYAFLNDGVLPIAYFKSSGRYFSHPDYPLALPFTQLWIYLWSGEANQFLAKTIFPVFYAVGAMLLALLTSRGTGQRWVGLVAGILLFGVPQLTVGAGSVLVGYVDFPVSVFYLAAIGYLLSSLKDGSAYSFAVYAISLAFLPWIKLEGAILWLVAALAGTAVIFAQRKSKKLLLALCPGLFLILGWQLFLGSIHATRSPDFLALNFSTFVTHLDRLPPIFLAVLTDMARLDHWSIFWLLLMIACIFMFWRLRSWQSLLLMIGTLLPIFMYSSTYVFSAWPDYLNHVYSSIPRLLMHVVPVAWLFIALSFAASTVSPALTRNREQSCEPAISGETTAVELV
jgi:hypothetical protein